MKNGIYKSDNAVYFIYNEKILMLLKGSIYKTNKNFMQGTFEKELTQDMMKDFDETYEKVQSW